jgi:hypothetical protein
MTSFETDRDDDDDVALRVRAMRRQQLEKKREEELRRLGLPEDPHLWTHSHATQAARLEVELRRDDARWRQYLEALRGKRSN